MCFVPRLNNTNFLILIQFYFFIDLVMESPKTNVICNIYLEKPKERKYATLNYKFSFITKHICFQLAFFYCRAKQIFKC